MLRHLELRQVGFITLKFLVSGSYTSTSGDMSGSLLIYRVSYFWVISTSGDISGRLYNISSRDIQVNNKLK